MNTSLHYYLHDVSSKSITMYTIVDGQMREEIAHPFPEGGNDEFITIGSAVDRLTLRQILLAGLDGIVHFNNTFARYEQQEVRVRKEWGLKAHMKEHIHDPI